MFVNMCNMISRKDGFAAPVSKRAIPIENSVRTKRVVIAKWIAVMTVAMMTRFFIDINSLSKFSGDIFHHFFSPDFSDEEEV